MANWLHDAVFEYLKENFGTKFTTREVGISILQNPKYERILAEKWKKSIQPTDTFGEKLIIISAEISSWHKEFIKKNLLILNQLRNVHVDTITVNLMMTMSLPLFKQNKVVKK